LDFQYKYSGNQLSGPYGGKGCQSCSLVPISRDCIVENPGGIVHHMPLKYAFTTKLVKENGCIQDLSGF